MYPRETYEVRYVISLDQQWNLQSFMIDGDINGVPWKVTGKKHDDKWKINNILDFADFKFIDISLTPLTNTLPIKNLFTEFFTLQEVKVLYIDILKNELKIVRQCYTQLDDNRYLYENTDTDFKAVLMVDKDGFVENYPALFERIL
ncbi:putative glycolipid-binding domain-containing protein [Chryseobacterium soli]|uniref:putative glycolipid-binding domain-containing protein n=1 Tax=Chryseobacterium soli TaxID=445961 RepID=UPI00295434AD|nr:putative glycolipid-binding domain-containing protein [Chryseobacterium soli]MDV7695523.1 putative glycolipid-binding domain-containing protein [Chryseobacterium soli]